MFGLKNTKNIFPLRTLVWGHRLIEDLTQLLMFFLNLLNVLSQSDNMRCLPIIHHFFRNELNKFNNTRAQMLDSSVYDIKVTFLKSYF